jgi:nucleoside-diphosphate-sugar epimerase
MKIVVIGGSGLIGSKLVKKLREHGQEAVAASPDSGVNALTSEGLADALRGAWRATERRHPRRIDGDVPVARIAVQRVHGCSTAWPGAGAPQDVSSDFGR